MKAQTVSKTFFTQEELQAFGQALGKSQQFNISPKNDASWHGVQNGLPQGSMEDYLNNLFAYCINDPKRIALICVACLQVTVMVGTSVLTHPFYAECARNLCKLLTGINDDSSSSSSSEAQNLSFFYEVFAKVLGFCTATVNGPYNYLSIQYTFEYIFKGFAYLNHFKKGKAGSYFTGNNFLTAFVACFAAALVVGCASLATYEVVLQAFETRDIMVFFSLSGWKDLGAQKKRDAVSAISLAFMANFCGMAAVWGIAHRVGGRMYQAVSAYNWKPGIAVVRGQLQSYTETRRIATAASTTFDATVFENLQTLHSTLNRVHASLQHTHKPGFWGVVTNFSVMSPILRNRIERFTQNIGKKDTLTAKDFLDSITPILIELPRASQVASVSFMPRGKVLPMLFLTTTSFLSVLGLLAGIFGVGSGAVGIFLGLTTAAPLFGLSLRNAYSYIEEFFMPTQMHFLNGNYATSKVYYLIVLCFALCAVFSFASTGLAAVENIDSFAVQILVFASTAVENFLPAGLTVAGVFTLCCRAYGNRAMEGAQKNLNTLKYIMEKLEDMIAEVQTQIDEQVATAHGWARENQALLAKV